MPSNFHPARPAVAVLRTAFCAALASGLCVRPAHAGGRDAGALVRDVERLIELRLTLQREDALWERQREAMRRRIDLLERERAALSARILVVERAHGERETAAREAEARVAETEAAFEVVASDIDGIRSRVITARDRVPEGVRDALPPPRAPNGDPVASLAHLIQEALELLRMDQEAHVTHLTLAAPDGVQRRFDALLLGLSQAYVVSADNRVAGHGVRTDREWVWTWNAAWGRNIRRAIAAAQGAGPPRRIPLPLGLGEREASAESRREDVP